MEESSNTIQSLLIAISKQSIRGVYAWDIELSQSGNDIGEPRHLSVLAVMSHQKNAF